MDIIERGIAIGSIGPAQPILTGPVTVPEHARFTLGSGQDLSGGFSALVPITRIFYFSQGNLQAFGIRIPAVAMPHSGINRIGARTAENFEIKDRENRLSG